MNRLQALATKWAASSNEWEPEMVPSLASPRLWVRESAAGVVVVFYGEPFDEPFVELVAALAEAPTAANLALLEFAGPDQGANGTCTWDLSMLVDKVASFPRLAAVRIQQCRPGDHNTHIVAKTYSEDGVLGRLLFKSPELLELESPSVPGENFFQTSPRPLRYLSVDAGYDTQNFIANLARARNLSSLTALEYGENEPSHDDGFQRATLEDYERLFRSDLIPLSYMALRNPAPSDSDLAALQSIRPNLQLKVVRSQARYVRRTGKRG